jgi:hypothetical protein
MRRTLALAVLAVSATLAAIPAAHAGCADDYLADGHAYLGPDVEKPVTVAGGVVTIDTNAVTADANNVAAFGTVVAFNEAGNAVTLVNCVA